MKYRLSIVVGIVRENTCAFVTAASATDSPEPGVYRKCLLLNVGSLEKSLTYLADYQSLSEEIGRNLVCYSYTNVGALHGSLAFQKH